MATAAQGIAVARFKIAGVQLAHMDSRGVTTITETEDRADGVWESGPSLVEKILLL